MKKAEDDSLSTNGRSSDIFNITFRNYVPKSTVLKERCKDAPNIKAIERQLDEDMRAAIASFQEKVLLFALRRITLFVLYFTCAGSTKPANSEKGKLGLEA